MNASCKPYGRARAAIAAADGTPSSESSRRAGAFLLDAAAMLVMAAAFALLRATSC